MSISYLSRKRWFRCFFALRLLFNFYRGSSHRKTFQETLNFPDGVLDHYEPRGAVVGTLVFIHGMSELGREDPRIVHLAEAIASVGYRVLVPDFPSIRSLEIRPEQVSEVLARLELLSKNEALVPEKFSLMAVSFSTVFALKAACHPRLARRISGLCLIGGYFDVRTMLSFVTQSTRSDPYANLILLWNYYRQFKPNSTEYQVVLGRCLSESISQDSPWDAERSLDQSDPIESQVYRMLTEPEQRNLFLETIKRVFEEDWREFNPSIDFPHGDVPVFLIHGRNDRIIPSGESKRVKLHLAKRGNPVFLCVTRFLDHGNSSLRLSQYSEVFQLIHGFAWFFRF